MATHTITPAATHTVESATTHTITRAATQTITPAVAAARASRATAAIGTLGIATAVFVVARAFASWQVGGGHGHTVSLFGGRLSYPAANATAIGVLALALLGALVAATAILAAAHELRAARRLDACLRAARRPDAGVARSATPTTTALGADAIVVEGRLPQAFCAGLVRPRVYITIGALERLDEAALAAVLEHERHHARRRDPLRLASGRVLSKALFFLPWLRALAERERSLAELSADDSATIGGDRSALARAMLAFEESGGIDPERVDRLLGAGDPPSWRFPTALFLMALFVFALLAGVAALGSQFASGSATLALPLLSRQPCVIMLALVPAGVGFLGLRAAGRMRAAWRAASLRERFQGPRSIA
jgi:Zn-dependent protease with chaperone function